MKRKQLLTILLLLLLAGQIFGAKVITWVAPYYINETIEQTLNTEWDGYGMKDGISHLALQYWVPNPSSGGIQFFSRSTYDVAYTHEDSIKIFTDWAAKYDIKVLLCLYNGENGWDWSIVESGILAHPQKTIKQLVDAVQKYNLDGVEVDLENPWSNQSEKTKMLAFVKELIDTMHSYGKEVTIATFPADKGNAPNWTWWPDLLNDVGVDGVTSMGYAEIGAYSTTASWSSYKAQADQAGNSENFMIGMPAASSTWAGNTTIEHLQWIKDHGKVGVGIWDSYLGAWRDGAVWKLLSEIRGPLVKTYPITATAHLGGTLSPAGEVSVDSAGSQNFTITPDKWFVVDYVLVNGENKGSITTHTFRNVTKEQSIEAFFKKDPNAPTLYTFSNKAHANGTISSAGESMIEEKGKKTITITPDAGYVVEKVLIDEQNRGPLLTCTFNNVLANHSIEAFFKRSSGGDLGKYGTWKSPHNYTKGDTIAHNDTLWKYQGNSGIGGWGSTMKPSLWLVDPNGGNFATPPWLYVGLYNGTPDTTIVGDLIYNSGIKDTLIITTKTIIKGVLTNTETETLYINGGTSIKPTKKSYKVLTSSLLYQNNKIYLKVNKKGIYTIKLYDLRGRELLLQKKKMAESGIIPLNLAEGLSTGLYLLQLSNGLEKSIQKIGIE